MEKRLKMTLKKLLMKIYPSMKRLLVKMCKILQNPKAKTLTLMMPMIKKKNNVRIQMRERRLLKKKNKVGK